MKKLLIFLLLLTILLSGCVEELTTVEIEYGVWNYTGEEGWGCRQVTETGINRAVVDSQCKAKCQQEGYTYNRWKCSEPETDEIICICNR